MRKKLRQRTNVVEKDRIERVEVVEMRKKLGQRTNVVVQMMELLE